MRGPGKATRRRVLKFAIAGLAVPVAGLPRVSFAKGRLRAPDVPYEPTQPAVVDEMIAMAALRAGDVVYDLGCGDGRIVIAAVKHPGVRGVCVEIDPVLIRKGKENARLAGVAKRIAFRNEDLFESKIRDATVVMLFLWPNIVPRLIPKLLNELRPGARIISHMWSMGELWKADEDRALLEVPDDNGSPERIYKWIVPEAGMSKAEPDECREGPGR